MEEVRFTALQRLRALNYHSPMLDALPYSDRTIIRDSKEALIRCIINAEFKALSIYPESFQETVIWMFESNVYKHCSQSELSTLKKKKFSTSDEIKYSWYSESLYSILLTVGIVKKRFGPNEEADIESYAKMIPPNDSFAKFSAKVNMLSEFEIYVLRDEYYLLHWLARHKLYDLNTSVILERRKGFEWISDASLEWDTVPLDT